MDVDILNIAGHVDHRQAGHAAQHLLGDRQSVHPVGQQHVGQQQIRAQSAFEQPERFAAIGRADHLIAEARQHVVGIAAHHVGILDDQDALAVGLWRRRFFDGTGRNWRGGGGFAALLAEPGQIEPHRGAAAFVADDANMAAGLGDIAVDHGEAESGAAAGRFRGEEGLEHLAEQLARNPAAIVGDRDDDVVARPQLAELIDVGLADDDVGGVDRQLADAAGGDGVACVDGEVDDRVFQLGRVDSRPPQGGGAADIERHPGTEGAAQ